MSSFARQADTLQITDEQALEGYWYLVKNRPSLAEKHEDYKQVRLEISDTIQTLALIEKAFGTRKVRDWLFEMSEQASKKLNRENAA